MALFELTLDFGDGTSTKEIVAGPVKIFPQRDDIVFSNCKRFKYKVKTKHTAAIVKSNGGTFIVGDERGWISCHPETVFDDLIIIDPYPPKDKIKVDIEVFEFKSKSSDSIYKVRVVDGKLKCNCPGMMRVKDKTKGCKHMQEVVKIIKDRHILGT